MDGFEEHVKIELALKEEIGIRQTYYIDVLKKEVTAAKSILGNPKLRDLVLSDLNFN